MKKEKVERQKYKVPCSLLRTKTCPHPNTCDGLRRKCTLWQTHSGK